MSWMWVLNPQPCDYGSNALPSVPLKVNTWFYVCTESSSFILYSERNQSQVYYNSRHEHDCLDEKSLKTLNKDDVGW